ncbi:MAG: FG-GAP-like repeat-containing protein, partial [Crocinitomicaceae bacterium]
MKIKNLFAKAFALLALVVFTSTGAFNQTITSFSPASGQVGSVVTITGTGFDATPANNVVYFGGVKAIVSTASSSQLVLTVPNNAGRGEITVTNISSGLTAGSSLKFSTTWPESTPITSINSNFNRFDFEVTAINGITGNNPSNRLASADFDGDGKIDIVKVGNSVGGTDIYLNTSTGPQNISFSSVFNVSSTLSSIVAINDLNNDGKLDLVTSSPGTAIDVWYNTSTPGNLSFSLTSYPNLTSFNSIRLGDIDLNGYFDIVYGTSSGIFYLPNSNSGFGSAISLVTGLSSGIGIELSDINLDGTCDVLFAQSGSFRTYFNSNGVLTFNQSVATSSNTRYTNTEFSDLDNDGDLDVLISGSSRYHLSSPSIGSANSFSCDGCGTNGIVSADFDGDGDIDVAHGAPYSPPRFQLNANTLSQGTFGFSNYLQHWISSGYESSNLASLVSDLDNNGKPDFITLVRNSTTGSAIIVFLNKNGEFPSITTTGSITSFSSCANVASASQTIAVSGSFLTANITAAAPTGFQVSLDGSTWANSVTINQSSGSASATLYVRMNALSSSPSNGNITLSSAGATNVTVAVSGVVNTCISVAASPTSLSGFSTTGANPSAAQTTSISGSGLTNDIVLTAPTGYEISLASASGYASSLTLTQTAGTVNATTIYVRLATAGTPGTYNGNLTVASTGATTVNIGLTGTVNATPLTTAVLSANQNPCGSTASGSATLVLDGDDAPFTYAWTRNGVAYSALPANAPTNLLSGTYVVTVTDASSNVVVSNSITLTNVASLTLSGETQSGTIVCNGATTGAISAVISGGGTAARVLTVTNTTTSIAYFTQTPIGGSPAAGFTYEVTGLPAGTYTVVASSTSSSCTSSGSNIIISEP